MRNHTCANRSHHHFSLILPNHSISLLLLLHNIEDTLNTDGPSNWGNGLARKHADKAVVATSAADWADVGALHNGLLDHSSLVVQAARQAEVEGDVLEAVEGLEVLEEQLHLGEAAAAQLRLVEDARGAERFIELKWLAWNEGWI